MPIHLYLDPVGGMAGDMFAAAMLDAWPELEPELYAALAAAGLSSLFKVQRHGYKDLVLSGSRFAVTSAQEHHHHRTFREIRALLETATLSAAVQEHALAIFRLLAEAEGQVHGVAVEDVAFHEVGAWDSIADIVVAAWLIDAIDATHWSCAALPMGRGRVPSAHGQLPVPTPATIRLLEGFPLFQDDLDGERITPTGAAILRHLKPSFAPLRWFMRLNRSGIGFGSKTFPGISNILRVLAFDTAKNPFAEDQVALCQFELDDQAPEDLAVALEHLRALPGVLDVMQAPVFGKKGRMAAHVQVLTQPEALNPVLEQCFTQTSTLGIRWQMVQRAVLARNSAVHEVAGQSVRVKHVRRPNDIVTAKAEMDDLADIKGGFAGREKLRHQAQDGALTTASDVLEENKND